MNSLWRDVDAKTYVEQYAALHLPAELALRTYSARLLGANPTLVLHGGGNTSVKLTMNDVLGDDGRVLCIKSSGWDLASIEPAGHPAVCTNLLDNTAGPRRERPPRGATRLLTKASTSTSGLMKPGHTTRAPHSPPGNWASTACHTHGLLTTPVPT